MVHESVNCIHGYDRDCPTCDIIYNLTDQPKGGWRHGASCCLVFLLSTAFSLGSISGGVYMIVKRWPF